MADQMTIADKQYMAKILFTREKLEQKVVSKKVGVSEKTMSKWVNDFGWKNLRDRLLIGKEEILSNLYEQLSELNTAIKAKESGKRYGDKGQADTQIKITASIRNLETELAISDLVESGMRFIRHLQRVGTLEQVMEIAELWNDFIQEQIKRS